MSGSDKNYSGSEDESSKPALLVKKKKKSEKPGYKMFEADDSDNEPVLYDDSAAKTPSTKLKKHSRPSFKFAGKIKLKEKGEKDEKKDVSEKKDEKEARKFGKVKDKDTSAKVKDKESKELKIRKKKDKLHHGFGRKAQALPPPVVNVEAESPVFGVALSLAVERTPSHDGVKLPICVRECIDYIEEHGLLYEGIYRISGVKSKVQSLKDAYNRRQPAYLYEHDPSIVASLLKQFLRELPEPVLTNRLMNKFEQASVIQDSGERLEQLHECINSLPPCNKELLSWMIVHMNHVIAKEKINKMSIQNVSIVLSPTMRISHRVLNVLFIHAHQLFSHIEITRYRPPLQPAASKWSVDLPETEEALQDELHKQESLLNQLHQELSHHHDSGNSDKEDRVWEVQRNVTQLKRKLKLISKTKAARELEKQQLTSDTVKRTDPNRRSINAAELNFALQTGSLRRNNRSQAELAADLASSSPSVTASSEALAAGQYKVTPEHKHSSSSLSKRHSRNSASSDTKPVPQRDDGAGEPVKHPTDLDLSNVQSDTSEHNEVTPVSPISRSLEAVVITDDHNDLAQTPDDDNAETLTHHHFTKLSQTEDDGEEDREMKPSTSQDSDVTLSAYADAGVSGSQSQQSFNEVTDKQSSESTNENFSSDQTTTQDEPQLDTTEVESIEPSTSYYADPASQSQAGEALISKSQSTDRSLADQVTTSDQSEHVVEASSELLIPERLHDAGMSSQDVNITSEASDVVYNIDDDDELRLLIAQEAQLIWEEEELIAMKDELKQKIGAEMIEIDRLHEEIAEYEELRSITTLGHSSECVSSDEYYSSTSDTEPEDDAAAELEVDHLAQVLHDITSRNTQCEADNAALVKKIHEERMGCLNVKIQIRLLQQQMLGAQIEEQSLI